MKMPLCGKKEELTNEERCQRVSQYYTEKYRDIPTMTFQEWTKEEASFFLVDARTAPERSVSMIEGAMTPTEFEEQLTNDSIENKRVLVYCTIGYRSGMEARRLQRKYRTLQIYNSDGIVAYTHAQQKEDAEAAPPLVDPATGKPTHNVHTFGSMWDFADRDYQTKHFPPHVLPLRMTQVGGLAVWRSVQRILP